MWPSCPLPQSVSSDSDLRHTPHLALPLKLALSCHLLVQLVRQVELQGPCSTAAKGCELMRPNGTPYITSNCQPLQPWQVSPHSWPDVIQQLAGP
jgi:hypothetical protein